MRIFMREIKGIGLGKLARDLKTCGYDRDSRRNYINGVTNHLCVTDRDNLARYVFYPFSWTGLALIPIGCSMGNNYEVANFLGCVALVSLGIGLGVPIAFTLSGPYLIYRDIKIERHLERVVKTAEIQRAHVARNDDYIPLGKLGLDGV